MPARFRIEAIARRLGRHEAGAISIVFGLSVVPLIAFAGAAVDYSRAMSLRGDIQKAVDAAALAGAQRLASGTPAGTTPEAVAISVLGTMLGGITPTVPPSVSADPAAQIVRVQVTARMATAFMRIMRIATVDVGASAAARVKPPTGAPVCLHALASTGTAISAVGATVNAAPCATWSNSTSTSSVSLVGAVMTSARNCLVGSSSSTGFTPAPERCAARPDPFAGTNPQETPACSKSSATTIISSSTTPPLQPCIYNGGITLMGSSPIRFDPGVYIIRGGSLNVVASGMTITGNNVVFVLEDGASVNLTGSGISYHLTGRTSGAFAGFLFYQRPTTTPGSVNITGSGGLYLEGVVYLPGSNVSLTGTTTAATTSPFTAYIAKTFSMTGSGQILMNYDRSRLTVPVPSSLFTGKGEVALIN